MSPRRLILAAGLGGLTLAGVAAVRPWPVDAGWAAAILAGPLAEVGLGLRAEGQASLSLLPLPRLSFARARLSGTAPGRPVLAEGGRLSVGVDPLALVAGRIALDAVALDGARIRLADASSWAPLLSRLSGTLREGGAGLPRRIRLTRSAIDAGPDGVASDVDLDLAWPAWSGALSAAGSFAWKGRRTELTLAGLRPRDLVAGTASPVSASLAWPGGSLEATGQARWADTLHVAGDGRLAIASLPETLGWAGCDAPLLPMTGALALEGSFEADSHALQAPRLKVQLGGNVLEGAGSVAFDGPRLAVQATLAAETLNLAPLLGALVRLFNADPSGRAPAVAVAPLTGGDLDLRLSAAAGRVGPLAAQDIAASVLVKPDTVEVALARASVRGGTVKGRVTLAAAGSDTTETEVRAQGAFDGVDLGGLLDEAGEGRWIAGPAQGHFVLETAGRDAAELAARVAGRTALTIDGGALTGLDLADVIHRNGAVAPGALARRNGRTPFERAGLSLRFADGVGEIGDGILRGPSLSAVLHGQVSLPERSVRVRGELVPRDVARPGQTKVTLFEIAGPWDAVTVHTAPRSPRSDDPLAAAAPGPDLPASARAFAP